MSSDDSFKEDNKGQLETGDFALDVEFIVNDNGEGTELV